MKLLIATASAVLFAFPVAAQNTQNCGPRQAVIEQLADKYGETRQAIGIGVNNTVMEVFASLETGTWTITVTSPNGLMCLAASGQAFENLAEALPDEDA